MKIAHLADIQIRFGSRHEEYRQVFERLYEDLRNQQPDRIYVAGDLVHHKINMSPGSFNLLAEFLLSLAEIAPTDVILGNHDLNLQQLEQGDAISPIFFLADLIEKGQKKRAYIVTEDNKEEIDFAHNAVYYYPDSGFYQVNDEIIYGVFSCKDDEILILDEKEAEKKYIAFYHGTVYGARNDNGYLVHGDNLMRLSTFNNFDMVMLGDIHEYQTFRDDETVAYAGSLIQQNFGESIDKGYLMWDTDDCTHERKFILNDYGFAKIDIAKGEDVEERIEYINFSNNRRKTKVYITWEDFEENYSIEKENQIKRMVKDKYGCERVNVEFKEIRRDIAEITEEDEAYQYNFEDVFKEYLDDGDFDLDDDLEKEIFEFASHVDECLGIDESQYNQIDDWDLNSIEISNILSFDKKPLIIDFDNVKGLTGIFGQNFNGKSNTIKALVWGLYEEIIGGERGSSKYLVNLYTDSDVGYVKVYLTINGERYRIIRKITTKNGKNTFNTRYQKLVKTYGDGGELLKEEWKGETSDRKTLEQKEVKAVVLDAIGTFDDFTKTSLQAQSGADDYINQKQQPKNDLINRFIGLEAYRERYDYANDFFKDVKKKQKDLGNAIDIEDKIKGIDSQIKDKTDELNSFKEEKEMMLVKQNDANDDIKELTKKLEKVDNSGITDPEKTQKLIDGLKSSNESDQIVVNNLEEWLSENHLKELPFKEGENLSQLEQNLSTEKTRLSVAESSLRTLKDWIKNNPIKEELAVSTYPDDIKDLKEKLSNLNNKLPTYQGKCCPTCGHVEHQADPIKEEECLDEIKMTKELIEYKEKGIGENNLIIAHNNKWQNESERVSLSEESIKVKRDSITLLEDKIKTIKGSQGIVDHNNAVKGNQTKLTSKKQDIAAAEKKITELSDKIVKFNANKDKIKNNREVQYQIDEKERVFKSYKLSVFNLDNNINKVYGEIKVLENNKENYDDKLKQINNSERLYKKYSVYLQAVHRDGIPASIIKRKLPIINSKVNSILQEIVDFKVDMDIQSNGNITETFYFSEDRSDALPLNFASGSQKFIISIVITEALRYMSRLTKPSVRIIDEGFGTLDEELTMGVVNILNYLRNKYKNVLFVTHRTEVKDFADNIIEVVKVTDGLDQEVIEKNPKAGVSQITIT